VGFNLPLKDGWDAQIVPFYQEKIVSGEIDTCRVSGALSAPTPHRTSTCPIKAYGSSLIHSLK
jgi:hypothetical protein